MAIADGLKVQVYPQVGDTAVKNIVDNSDFTVVAGLTPTLSTDGGTPVWLMAADTFLKKAIASKILNAVAGGNGVTIALRFKRTTTGTNLYMDFAGVSTSGGAANSGVRFVGFDGNLYRGRASGSAPTNTAVTTTAVANGNLLTLVYRFSTLAASSAAPNMDRGSIWQNRVGRVGTDPDAITYSNANTITIAEAMLNAQTGSAWTLFDFAYFDTEKSDADCAAIADDYRGVMPAPGSGTTPIAFTGTIPNQTATVGVPFSLDVASYFTGTQTPFSYALATGDLTGTGLSRTGSVISGTPTTAGAISGLSISGTDADLNVATSNSFTITVAAAGSPPAGTFTVGTITTTQTTASVPYTYSASDQTGIQYRIDGGTAITASASPQSITGLTAGTTYGIEFRAVNSFGNGAWSTSAPFTTQSAVGTGTFTTGVLRRLVGGAILANTAMTYFRLYNPTTGALVLNRTDLSTDANGRVTCSDAALTTGVEYKADWLAVTGETRMSKKAAT